MMTKNFVAVVCLEIDYGEMKGIDIYVGQWCCKALMTGAIII